MNSRPTSSARNARSRSHEGGARSLRRTKKEIEALRANLKQAAVVRDIVPEHVLLDWLDVSRKTLKRWGVPVNSEQGQTRFYHMPTVIDTWPRKRRTRSSS